MTETRIIPYNAGFEEYLRDEARRPGWAESISFPRSGAQVASVLSALADSDTLITVQGGRTGLAAGAVPQGGHILNLSRMDRLLDLRRDEQGSFYLRAEPGLTLSRLRQALEQRVLRLAEPGSQAGEALAALRKGPPLWFSPDPTETSATLGGMAACNASGARSFRYGPVRPYISGLDIALADGDILRLSRGECMAAGRLLKLRSAGGREIEVKLPEYQMPGVKNASGYYVADNMDAVDLFIGSDGTLGVIIALELRLLLRPGVIWGLTCFFSDERQAIALTESVRRSREDIAAVEFFDCGALDILRQRSRRRRDLPLPPEGAGAALYIELHCADKQGAYERLACLSRLLEEAGGDAERTWAACTAADLDRAALFRHAIPEAVNELIAEYKRAYPAITKLSSDMAAPDRYLGDLLAMYRRSIAESGLDHAIWGHIGDNHLHANLLPKNDGEYARGKELLLDWARFVCERGGSVSAEHGVGKLKAPLLALMYGEQHIAAMRSVKAAFDPQFRLGRGNMFD